jgi:hypothetical protein
MQTPLQREGIRRRLADLVRERHKELTCRTVAQVSADARVHYTSLARFLLYSGARRTQSLRDRTLDAVALALDTNPQWLRDGQGPKQLALWPLLLPRVAEGVVADPVEQVRSIIDDVNRLPEPIRVPALRSAVAAILETVTRSGETMGESAYRCLMRLDALQRSLPSKRAAV